MWAYFVMCISKQSGVIGPNSAFVMYIVVAVLVKVNSSVQYYIHHEYWQLLHTSRVVSTGNCYIHHE